MPLPSPPPTNYKACCPVHCSQCDFRDIYKETETNQTITSFNGVKLSSADEFAAEFDAPRHDLVVFNVTPLNWRSRIRRCGILRVIAKLDVFKRDAVEFNVTGRDAAEFDTIGRATAKFDATWDDAIR